MSFGDGSSATVAGATSHSLPEAFTSPQQNLHRTIFLDLPLILATFHDNDASCILLGGVRSYETRFSDIPGHSTCEIPELKKQGQRMMAVK